MENKLQKYFPLIRNRQQILDEIQNHKKLKELFYQWNEQQQNKFLDFCSGVCGVKMLYDSFFKEVLNPDTKPERLEGFLALALNQKVKILSVLPNESNRIADENSLLIMDIVIRLADGSIANVECQKIGYSFPGQRAACYSADLLMRQYRRVKKEKGKTFSYRDIKKVYTIIFYEKSSKEFYEFPDIYVHHSTQKTDSGVKIELLQEFVYFPLDIYFKYHHNKGIRNELEAWLTFLGSDKPEDIVELLDKYPQFGELYEDVYELCLNTERVMRMFSKELLELDRNTVKYMIDEMQNEIDGMQLELEKKHSELERKVSELEKKDSELKKKDSELKKKDVELEKLKKRVEELEDQNKKQIL